MTIKDYKKVKFPGRDISALAAKGLNKNMKTLKKSQKFVFFWLFNPLSARIFTDFELKLLEDRVLHKGAWVATLLDTLLGVQDYKKVKFSGRDISSLAAKG